ncbi:hypothetical protein HK096_000575 [Nowakowskiella sp. JEL0078]|nr:hypothetical protein HK096_000575 [Nowakowskiella sp. JEL0078]
MGEKIDYTNLQKWTSQLVQALIFLHSNGIIHQALSLSNVMLTDRFNVKIAGWGLGHYTGYGADVSFPIGNPLYLSPEFVAYGENKNPIVNSKVDIWALGILLTLLYYGLDFIDVDDTDLYSIFELISPRKAADGYLSTKLADYILTRINQDTNIDLQFSSFIRSCLITDIYKRPTSKELQDHEFLKNMPKITLPTGVQIINTKIEKLIQIDEEMAAKSLESLPNWKRKLKQLQTENEKDPLHELTLFQCFSFWKISGGDVEAELVKNGAILETPQIELLPTFVSIESEEESKNDYQYTESEAEILSDLYSDDICTISFSEIREQLLTSENSNISQMLASKSENKMFLWRKIPEWNEKQVEKFVESDQFSLIHNSKMPIQFATLEKNLVYQFNRIRLFDVLLKEMPLSYEEIKQEATIDIPPLHKTIRVSLDAFINFLDHHKFHFGYALADHIPSKVGDSY